MAIRVDLVRLDADVRPFQDKLRDAIAELRKFQQFQRDAAKAGIKLDPKERREFAREEKRLRDEILRAERDFYAARSRLLKAATQESQRHSQLRTQALRDAEKEAQRIFADTLKGITRVRQEEARKLKEAEEKALRFSKNVGRAIDSLQKKQLTSLSNQLSRISHQLSFFTGAAVVGGVGGFLKLAVDLNREYQRQETTLATILGLTTKITDAQGKEVSTAEAVRINFEQSRSLITQIRDEADKTILEQQELQRGFALNLGEALRAGLKVGTTADENQVLKLVSPVQQILKSQGLSNEVQVSSEIRSLLTGKELERSTIGRILGVTKKDIEAARESGRLFDFLIDKLKGGDPFIKKFETSFDAIFSTLITRGKEFARLSLAATFEKLTKRIGDLNKFLTQQKIEEFAEKFSDALVSAFESVDRFLKSDTFKALQSFFTFLVRNAKTLTELFIAMKGLQAVGAAGALLKGLGGILGGTAAGGVLAGIGGAALPVLAAGATGVGIGLGAQALGREAFGVNQAENQQIESVRRLQALQARNPSVTRRLALQERLREQRRALREEQRSFLGSITPESLGTLGALDPGRKRVDAARARVSDTERLIKEENERINTLLKQDADKKAKIAGDQVNRISRGEEDRLRRLREQQNKERIETAIQLAELTGDKEKQIRATAELDKLKAAEEIKDKKRLRTVLAAIDKAAIEEIVKLRREEAFKVREILAEASGNEIAQIRIRGERRIFEARDEIKNVKDRAKVIRAIRAETERKELERRKEIVEAVRELEIKSRDVFRDLADSRKKIDNDLAENKKRRIREIREQENQAFQATKRFARESRHLARETADAQKDLTRALEDQAQTIQEVEFARRGRGLDRGSRDIFNGLFGTAFQDAGLQGRRLQRDIAGQVASGDAEGAIERLRQLGFGGQDLDLFGQRARDIEEGRFNLEEEQEGFADRQAGVGERRRLSDAGRSVEDSRDRLAEAAAREVEARETFNRDMEEIQTKRREIEETFRVRNEELLAQRENVERNFQRSFVNLQQEADKLQGDFLELGRALKELPAAIRGLLGRPVAQVKGSMEEFTAEGGTVALPAEAAAANATRAPGQAPTITNDFQFSFTMSDGRIVSNLPSSVEDLAREFGQKIEREMRNLPTG